jgi:hypothetical protein
MNDGLCAHYDPRVTSWFPEQPDLDKKIERVIAICRRCPSQATCLADARARREKHGVWGGVDFTRERARTEWVGPVWTGVKASMLEGAA